MDNFLDQPEDIFGDYSPDNGMQEPLNEWLKIEEKMDEGGLNPMDAYSLLYAMKRQFDDVFKRVKTIAEDKRFQYENEQITSNGYELKIVSKPNYDFSHDERYVNLKNSLKAHETAMKKAYQMSLKNQNYTDPETGEIIEPCLVGETKYIKMEKIK